MKNRKKKIAAFSLAFILATTITSDHHKSQKERIYKNLEISNPLYAGSCLSGDVYIGSEDQISYLESTGIDGIFVIDYRSKSDPNVRIMDSYSIKNRSDMKDVLAIIKQYDEENPSKWSRTITSMVNEWWAHNICYENDYYVCHSKDVDLNNGDEEVFDGLNVYRLILRKKELNETFENE